MVPWPGPLPSESTDPGTHIYPPFSYPWAVEEHLTDLTGPNAATHGFGVRPVVSDGPYQPVDAADVLRRVVFGARQDNEFAVRHCCVLWAALVDVGGARDASKAPANRLATSRASKREVDGPTTNRIFYSRSLSIFRERSPTSDRGPCACHQRRGKGSNGGSSPQCGEELCLLGTVSRLSALEVAGSLRSIGT